jgi:hypothetical protein
VLGNRPPPTIFNKYGINTSLIILSIILCWRPTLFLNPLHRHFELDTDGRHVLGLERRPHHILQKPMIDNSFERDYDPLRVTFVKPTHSPFRLRVRASRAVAIALALARRRLGARREMDVRAAIRQ